LIFLLGNVVPADSRSVAVIGTREPSAAGLSSARKIAGELVQGRYTVISGLARGIDTAVQRAALGAGGRTLAVIGTGVQRSYPPENAALQRQIASRGAVVSQFRPDTPPARENFPRRNAVMSGLALATVIVEAGPRSGARIQARLALGHGRPVLLMRELLELDWAAALSGRAGVHVVSEPQEIPPLVDELSATDIVAI
jgi:DNA processing protein